MAIEEGINAHQVHFEDAEHEQQPKRVKISDRLGTKVDQLKSAYLSILGEEKDNQDDLRSIIKRTHKKSRG